MININDKILTEADADEMYFMLHVAKHMNKDNFAWPANQTLCESTKWEIKKLQRVKTRCIEKGFIEIVTRFRPGGGMAANGYRVMTDSISVFVTLQGKGERVPQNGVGGIPQNGIGAGTPKRGRERSINNKEVLTKIGKSQFSVFEQIEHNLSGAKLDALLSFLEYRKESKKAYRSVSSLKKIIEKFESMPEQSVVDAVAHSIENGWQGLFFDKKQEKAVVQIEKDSATITPYDDLYQKYLDWVRQNCPLVMAAVKYFSKPQYVLYREMGERVRISDPVMFRLMKKAHTEFEEGASKAGTVYDHFTAVIAAHRKITQEI